MNKSDSYNSIITISDSENSAIEIDDNISIITIEDSDSEPVFDFKWIKSSPVFNECSTHKSLNYTSFPQNLSSCFYNELLIKNPIRVETLRQFFPQTPLNSQEINKILMNILHELNNVTEETVNISDSDSDFDYEPANKKQRLN